MGAKERIMNVVKIGQFIKELRKEKSFTQKEVAERLNVSEKTVSKWETGRGLPDLGYMLPLCKLFGISTNELLSGERLNDKQYVEKAEENIASLVSDRTSPRKKVIVSTVSCVMATLSSLALVLISAYFINELWLRLVLIGIAVMVVVSDVAVILLVAVSAEIYECERCGEKFVPGLSAYLFAPHTFRRRYLKCPFCKKKSWDKSHLKK